MDTMTIAPEEVLERATARVKSDRNMEMMDRVTLLRGYLGLRSLDPQNRVYRTQVEDAVARLLPLLERPFE